MVSRRLTLTYLQADQKVGDMYYVTADSSITFGMERLGLLWVGVAEVASDIEFTPTGGIAATNVQTAIVIDTEKSTARHQLLRVQ